MRIVIGGQIEKEEIRKLVEKHINEGVEIIVKSDLDAAMDLKDGKVDYYIGACNTGGGGALAMAIALAGAQMCVTLSMPGRVMSEQEIINEVNSGKKAFGFTAQDRNFIVPIICGELNKMEK